DRTSLLRFHGPALASIELQRIMSPTSRQSAVLRTLNINFPNLLFRRSISSFKIAPPSYGSSINFGKKLRMPKQTPTNTPVKLSVTFPASPTKTSLISPKILIQSIYRSGDGNFGQGAELWILL